MTFPVHVILLCDAQIILTTNYEKTFAKPFVNFN